MEYQSLQLYQSPKSEIDLVTTYIEVMESDSSSRQNLRFCCIEQDLIAEWKVKASGGRTSFFRINRLR